MIDNCNVLLALISLEFYNDRIKDTREIFLIGNCDICSSLDVTCHQMHCLILLF